MKKEFISLGLNFGGHDTSACLMINGKIISACEEERYIKEKHTRNFPINAINDCLKTAGITIHDIDEISLSYNPELLKLENFTKINSTRENFSITDLKKLKELRKQDFELEKFIRKELHYEKKITSHMHHLCHLASCYYPSGFDETLVMSHDGLGEIDCSLIGTAKNGEIKIIHNGNQWPHSLGLLYAAITDYLGWKYNSDEGIVMGLAPYGDDKKLTNSGKTYSDIFQEIIKPDKLNYVIDKSWIAFHEVRSKWISDKFIETFGPRRIPDGKIEEYHKNVACALQNRLEEIILYQLKICNEKFGLKKLCFAGGIALNCSLNGKILESGLFDEIFVPPASGDNGTSIGACYLTTKQRIPNITFPKLNDYYIGSKFSDEQILTSLQLLKIEFEKPKNFEEYVAKKLKEEKIIGWFQGGAEFGPRALGNRSILTSPFPEKMKDIVNSRVKFREEFRPFAPAILSEMANLYFEINQTSPHMLIAVKVRKEKINEIPAVVHVDHSARVQTVSCEDNPKFRHLIEAFYNQTGCPVVLNTSFNVKGQPIVNSPEDAIKCFLSTNIDVLAIGQYVALKENNN